MKKLKVNKSKPKIHADIRGMNTSFTVGNNPEQGKNAQININIPTGRR